MMMTGKNLLFLLLFPLLSFGQETLNNQSVIDMIEIGFEEQVIIDKIESTSSDFDTSIESLKLLKQSGVSSSLLSAMLKASKKETPVVVEKEKKASPPKPNDADFYWEDGKGELVKVTFMLNIGRDFTIDESELAGFTNMIMIQAKMELKVPSSFRPNVLLVRKRAKSDNYYTKNNKTPYVMQLGSSGTNAYGGVVDGFNMLGINPTLIPIEKSEEDIVQEAMAKNFIFKKVYLDGKSVKMTGKVSIQKDNLLMTMDATESPRMSIKDREIISDNHWEVETDWGGIKTIIEYNGNETKYKSDGGILIVSSMGYKQVFPLIKSN